MSTVKKVKMKMQKVKLLLRQTTFAETYSNNNILESILNLLIEHYTIEIMPAKTIKTTIFVILVITWFVTVSTVKAATSTCISTQYCKIGDVCVLDSPTNKKICQPGPDDCHTSTCGNGYTCDPTSKLCTQDNSQGIPIGLTFQENFETLAMPVVLGEFFSGLLSQAYAIALILMLIYLIWGCYRFILAAGNLEENIKARQHILWAIIGEIVVFIAYWSYAVVNEIVLYLYS